MHRPHSHGVGRKKHHVAEKHSQNTSELQKHQGRTFGDHQLFVVADSSFDPGTANSGAFSLTGLAGRSILFPLIISARGSTRGFPKLPKPEPWVSLT